MALRRDARHYVDEVEAEIHRAPVTEVEMGPLFEAMYAPLDEGDDAAHTMVLIDDEGSES